MQCDPRQLLSSLRSTLGSVQAEEVLGTLLRDAGRVTPTRLRELVSLARHSVLEPAS